MSDEPTEALAKPSPLKRREIIHALRVGAVPRRGLELFSVGLGLAGVPSSGTETSPPRSVGSKAARSATHALSILVA